MRTALLCFAFALAISARAEPGPFIEAELEPARVYVGAEARLTLRVLREAGVAPGTLRPPSLGEAGDISLLGVRMYQTERAGVAYQVFERTNVLVPLRAGPLVVPGAEFESAQYLTELFGRNAERPRILRGPQTILEVLPPPAGAGEPFLPARSLTLTETWSRDLDALSAGQPVTRTLTLRAEGLAAQRLPRLEMAAAASMHVHHDQPELSTEYPERGMVGRRVQRIVLMPVAEGAVALPAMHVRWWDVGADAGRIATLPARTLRLQPLIAPVAAPAEAPAIVSPGTALRSLGAAILLLAVAALWLHLRGQAPRDARAKLRAACRRNDARGARDALLAWWRAVQRVQTAPRVQHIGAAWGAEARAALWALDGALYAGRAWDGKAFWRAVRPWLRRRRAAPVPPATASLFRLQSAR